MRRLRARTAAPFAAYAILFVYFGSTFIFGVSRADDEVSLCKRQPFRGRCPPTRDGHQTRSQFVLRYYLRNGECVSYPYGHCANDETEPKLFRYKEECEDYCLKDAEEEVSASATPVVVTSSTTTVVAASATEGNEVGLLDVGNNKGATTTNAASDIEEVEETTMHQETYGTNAPLRPGYEIPKTECQRQRERASGLIKGGFVPVCTPSGDFQQLQCEPDGQTCFCVSSEGIEMKNSRGQPGQPKPDCEKISTASPMRTNECTGGADAGPCRAFSTRWYYDEMAQACKSFEYSGCGGNGNNYASEATCRRRCVTETASSGVPKCAGGVAPLQNAASGSPVSCAKTDCPTGYKCNVIQENHHICCPDVEKSSNAGVLRSDVEPSSTVTATMPRCAQPKDRGPCDHYELRFYYNSEQNECKYFFYGGCEGNENNFKQVEDCEKACASASPKVSPQTTVSEGKSTKAIDPETTVQEEFTPSTTSAASSEAASEHTKTSNAMTIEQVASSSSSSTDSTTASEADSSPTTTDKTIAPRFESIQTTNEEHSSANGESLSESTTSSTVTAASSVQPRQPQPTLPPQQTVRTQPPTTTVPLPTNNCKHPLDRGHCGGQFVRWFWNSDARICETFTYTGCGGNGNNFASREECLGKCHKEVVKPVVLESVDLTNVCDDDIDVGECGGTFMRYAFDRAARECRQFKYGGCGGNGNNFASLADCKHKCLRKKGSGEADAKSKDSAFASQHASLTPTNICEHEIDSGECTGLFSRFAYESDVNECRAFNYGGCGGNGNNFATVDECRSACVKAKCAPEPECDASRCQLVRDAHGCPFCSCPPTPRHPPLHNRGSVSANAPSILCPTFDIDACTEPCIVFTNRVGCRECVCPMIPSTSATPSQTTDCALFDAQQCASPCIDIKNRNGCHECACPVAPQILPNGDDDQQQPEISMPELSQARRPPASPNAPPTRHHSNALPTAPAAPSASPAAPPAPAPPAPAQGVRTNEQEEVPPPPPPPSPVAFGELGEKCTQPLDPGPCRNFVERWHFNPVRAECEPFQYGGCAGNRNHFFTQVECMVHCGRFLPVGLGASTPSTTVMFVASSSRHEPTLPPQSNNARAHPITAAVETVRATSTKAPAIEIDDTCIQPPEPGPCTDYVPRWFFNAQTAKCEMFSYGSCAGNKNNFMDRTSCEARCRTEIEQLASQLPIRCTRSKAEGFGTGYFPKWYYNQKNLRCEQFVYQGAGGNDNQFTTSEDCERSCKYFKSGDENGSDGHSEVLLPSVPLSSPSTEAVFVAPHFSPKPILHKEQQHAASADSHHVREELSQGMHKKSASERNSAEILGARIAQAKPEENGAPATAQPIDETVPPEKPKYPSDLISKDAQQGSNNKLPIIGPSMKAIIDYAQGKRLESNDEANNRAFGQSLHVPAKSDEIQQFSKVFGDGKQLPADFDTAEAPKMPICPNGLSAMQYADGRPVMCLPGKNQCPDKSVCYFNGLDYFCCPNEDDPYDKHVFGGYDGEEVKHGYKDYPARLSISSIRRSRRQANLPPMSFSLDQVQSSLRFDDKPVHRISSAGPLASRRVSPCLEDVQRGTCNEAHLRYFYDVNNNRCRLFYFSGCGGNTNNFVTQTECEQRCKFGAILLSNRSPANFASTTTQPTAESETPAASSAQCAGGEAPLGDPSPVLCGNRTDSIGCPSGYYCQMGPPDVCCPTVASDDGIDIQQVLQSQHGDVRRKPFISGAGVAGHNHDEHQSDHDHNEAPTNRKYDADGEAASSLSKVESKAEPAAASTHSSPSTKSNAALASPLTMCPDGSDALLSADGAAMQCGTGFDGHDLCPRGYYCSIDPERNGRLCCPLAIQGSNLPAPGAIAPYFGHRGANPGEVLERGSLPSDPKPPKLITPKPRHQQSGVHMMMDYEDERSLPSTSQPENTAAQSQSAGVAEVAPALMPHPSGSEYDHLIIKNTNSRQIKEMESRKPIADNRFDREFFNRGVGGANEDPFEMLWDRRNSVKNALNEKSSACHQRPSEGRHCHEGEPIPRSNLQFFYSEQDRVCKIFFYRGCGGNANRFDTKRECEQFCMVKA